MSEHYQYVPDADVTRAIKAAYGDLRTQQARAWRRTRKKSPELARLLWRRMREAERRVFENWWGVSPSGCPPAPAAPHAAHRPDRP